MASHTCGSARLRRGALRECGIRGASSVCALVVVVAATQPGVLVHEQPSLGAWGPWQARLAGWPAHGQYHPGKQVG